MLRRVVVLCLVMFWMGGFTFYAAVVVPVGTQVLGGSALQGDITQRVTNWMNLAGAVALLAWAWDLAAAPDARRRRQLLGWALWAFMAVGLALLVWWHPRMDELRDAPEYTREIQRSFRRLHKLYLWTSTFQWAAALGLIYLTVSRWRTIDAARTLEATRTP
jgi:hypothetical protein